MYIIHIIINLRNMEFLKKELIVGMILNDDDID